ncbi:MAG TPA: PP2C family protein-serine/threonine phosphatase [Acidimicrobiia bacterium]|nr:PP2C family protein-serine/threonine phosphatase [Acidimicrobiia bacterium]
MPSVDLGLALRLARNADPASVPAALAAAAGPLGATDLVVYLVDFGQTVLEPVPDLRTHANVPLTEGVGTTMAGRAFVHQRAVTAERNGETRVWVPVVEGSDRTGVLALTVPDDDDATLRSCEELGLFAGYLIATQSRCTDLYNLYRRRKAMTLAASIQWDLLPPLVVKAGDVAVAGLIEPAYEVGGDCFDYAVNGPVLDVAIIDAMGHGLTSAAVSGVALGSYRHDRREGKPLTTIHENLAAVLTEHCGDRAFASGLLLRLDIATGEMSWTNAGHPLPLLVRGGRVIGELEHRPTPPWGLFEGVPTEATETLEPGDAVLLYTDGVIEARSKDGDEFGLERLADLVGQQASEEAQPEEVVRRLVRSVLEHQASELADDATVVLVQWQGPTPHPDRDASRR